MLLFDVGLGWVTENGPTSMSDVTAKQKADAIVFGQKLLRFICLMASNVCLSVCL